MDIVALAAWIIVLSFLLPVAIYSVLWGGVALAWSLGTLLDLSARLVLTVGSAAWDLLDWCAGRPVGWQPPVRPKPQEEETIMALQKWLSDRNGTILVAKEYVRDTCENRSQVCHILKNNGLQAPNFWHDNPNLDG